MDIWLISDWHGFHTNICGPKISTWTKGYRDFDNLDQMHDCIITNTNSLVKKDDKILYGGDLVFGKDKFANALWLMERINCKNIIGIKGNHDDKIWNKDFLHKIYKEWYIRWEGKLSTKYCVFDHYPLLTWNHAGKASINIHGHCHGNLERDENALRIDVGFDCEYDWHKKYFPFHIEDVIKEMNKRTFKPVDHHNGETQ